eukprot:1158924-Pelagomonas_calceolata.AAC.19
MLNPLIMYHVNPPAQPAAHVGRACLPKWTSACAASVLLHLPVAAAAAAAAAQVVCIPPSPSNTQEAPPACGSRGICGEVPCHVKGAVRGCCAARAARKPAYVSDTMKDAIRKECNIKMQCVAVVLFAQRGGLAVVLLVQPAGQCMCGCNKEGKK